MPILCQNHPNYAPDFRNYAHCRDHESARVKVMAELAVTYAFTELKKTFVEEQMCATYSRVRYYLDTSKTQET